MNDEIFYKLEYDFFLNKIKNNQHFKYSRFNDGELIAINGKNPNSANCDNHKYFPSMGVELKNILLNYTYNDNYIIQSFDYWYNTNNNIKQIHHDLKKQNPNLKYLNSDFIRIMHENDSVKFKLLLDLLKTKKLVIVGPKYLNNLKKHFNITHIEVPLVNCYLNKDIIINEIRDIIKKDDDLFFLFSASMATNIIIDVFSDDYNNTYLDWGSVWDTFFISNEFNFIKKRSTSNKNEIIENYKEYLI
jgi:hypothetical protein